MKSKLAALPCVLAILLVACGGAETEPTPEVATVGVVIDAGSQADRSFNQYTLEGARRAAETAGLSFFVVEPQSAADYEAAIERAVDDGAELVIASGFRMGDATSKVAQRHPEVKFAIVDTAYFPGAGCAEDVADCYIEEGGLFNVTSLMFAEDEIGYLAGVLAACMTVSGTIASVAGVEIPPVVRFVTGYQNGARHVRPEVTTLNQYIPDFNDPDTGKVVAQDFILQGADVIFGVGGNTGNGGLLAAHEAGLMAIGVDVDQYFTYPEVAPTLLTSASKNVDVASASAVESFARGTLEPGLRIADLENGGIGLAPYHDWEDRIPQECKDLVISAEEAILADPAVTGAK
jgi:basic membrane protein A